MKKVAVVFVGFWTFIAVILGAHFSYKNRHALGSIYAYQFELPVYSEDRENSARLTGGRYPSISEVRVAAEYSLQGLDFTPYLRTATVEPAGDAAKIIETGFGLRGNPTWRVGISFDWGNDPKSDRNWRFRMNSPDHLEAFAADFYRNKNLDSLDVFEAGLFDWIDFNLVSNQENEFKWYDMSTGIRATRLAFLYYFGIQEGQLSDQELIRLLMAMDMHVQALTNPRLLNVGNHGLFQMLGLAAICKVAPILVSCGDAARYANAKFAEIARAQFTPEGMHAEHSSQYHPWSIKTINHMLDYNYIEKTDLAFLDQARSNAIHYFYPDGSMTLLGDTGEQHVCTVRKMHPSLEYLCSGGENGTASDQEAVALMDSGYVVIRDTWNQRPLKNQSYFFLQCCIPFASA